MKKLQTLSKEIDSAKEEILLFTNLTLSDSEKGGELDPKLEAALEEKKNLATELKKDWIN